MKRFISAVLAAALILTSSDFSVFDLSLIVAHAASAVTDAYDAYDELRNTPFSRLTQEVNDKRDTRGDAEQNPEPNRYNMIFGQVEGGSPQTEWGLRAPGVTTSPGYGTPAKFNQQGIDGTAQVKAGEWLNETTYDSTAGVPTTENLFVTVGGTQYLVDIDYEYIYRPYIRRYHFSASTPNYRYYAFDDDKSLWSEQMAPIVEWETTEVTDWEHNLATNDSVTNALGKSALILRGDDLRNRNIAYISSSIGARVKDKKELAQYADDPSVGVRPYVGRGTAGDGRRARAGAGTAKQGLLYTWDTSRYPEEEYRIDDWYNCGYKTAVDKDTMSPGMVAAIEFKKQVAEAILELKNQYATIDDNYRADQGAINIDSPSSDNDDWMLEDVVSWMYTYYGMVRRDAHGSGGVDAAGESLITYSEGNSTNYESENVWHPIITSYYFDWDGYGTAGSDVAGLAQKQDSDTWVSDIKVDTFDVSASMHTMSGPTYGSLLNSMWYVKEKDNDPHELAYGHWCNTPLILQQTSSYMYIYQEHLCSPGYAELHGIPNPYSTTYSWYADMNLWLDAWHNIENYSSSMDFYDFAKNWLVYLDSNSAMLQAAGSSYPFDTKLGLDEIGQYGVGPGSMNPNASNQLMQTYYRAIYDLFASVSGLFYTDEIEELFGGEYNFPGILKGTRNNELGIAIDQGVAQNIYWLFGVPIENGENSPLKLEKEWAIPWAVFPIGGDLDGAMEDTSDGTSNGDYASITSTRRLYTMDMSAYQIFLPMMVCPQFVKYTKFNFYVEIETTDDSMHWNSGHDYWYKWHDECQENHSHKIPQWVCDMAKLASPPAGYGPHNCHYCTSTDGKTGAGAGHYQGDSSACGTYGCEPDCYDCDTPGHGRHHASDCHNGEHQHSAACTDVCAEHWHSFSNLPGYVHNTEATAASHDTRAYKESIRVKSYSHPKMYVGNDDAVTGSGESLTWTEQYKNLSYNETIAQTFRNVRYLNIISYSIWNYDRAEVRGLGHLLATPVNTLEVTNSASASPDLIVTNALSSMGYSIYDIDEHAINNDIGSGIAGNPSYWNNLEHKGRIANSFHEDSLGNVQDPYRNTLVAQHDVHASNSGTKFNTIAEIQFINTSDVPALNYYGTGSPYKLVSSRDVLSGATPNTGTGSNTPLCYKNFTNGDRTTFKLVDTRSNVNSDDLYFEYYPLSQGGRSHSTFGGFVAQALARTLYTYVETPNLEYTWKSGYTSEPTTSKQPYSNSLRIQGDYLAIRDLQGNTTTITGSMYDTWDERELGSATGYHGIDTDSEIRVNKYNILKVQTPSGTVPLAQYLTADGWVMGSLSYILSRVPYNTTIIGGVGSFGIVSAASDVTCLTNCWMIHSYCQALNMGNKSYWDDYYDSLGLIINHNAIGTSTEGQLGEINPWMPNTDRGAASRMQYAVYPEMRNKKGDDLHLRSSLNSRYRPIFQLPDGTWSTEVILNYRYEGNNAGENFANWSNQRTSNLVTNVNDPLQYIGYQTDGDGTKNIIATGDDVTTQTGFTDSDIGKVFNADKTMVTANTGNPHYGKGTYRDEGGFQRFGINTTPVYGHSVYDNGRDIISNEEIKQGNVRDPYDDGSQADSERFSRWYPWLADVNTSRYLPNGRYFSSQIYNVYKLAIRNADGGGAGGTYDYNRVPYGTDEVRVNTHYKRSGAGGGGTASETLPNSVVMYNPATTFTAHLVKLDDYMPDEKNYGIAAGGSRRYLAGYGDGFGKLILRDQRVGRHQTYGSEGTEDYNSEDGVITIQGTQSSSSYHYEMRYHDVTTQNFMYYESLIETKAYTMEDYDIKTTSNEVIDLTTTTEGRYHTFQERTTLKMITKDQSGKYHAATVNVEPGDTITWEDSAAILTRGSDNFSLTYSAFQEAFKQMELSEGVAEDDLTNTVDFIPMTRGTVMNPINGVFNMRAGSVIELSLPLTTNNDDPIDLPFELQLPDSFIWKHERDGIYHKFYIEATEDAILSSIEMTAATDYRIQAFSDSAIKAHNVLLMSVGIGNGLAQVPVENATTLNYYYESSNYSVNTVERWGSYNSTVVDISGSYEFLGVDISVFEVNHLYIQNQNGAITVSLDQSDPHKVPNTNWRYYVLGWKTEYGDFITSVYDPALNENSTVRLIPPIGATDDNYLNAVILDNAAKSNKLGVGRYGNNFYLMELTGNTGGDQYDYTLDWYGMRIGEFDTLSFGEETTKTYGTLVSWEQTTETMKTQVYLKSYEFVFRCSWGQITKTTEIEIGMYSGCTREVRAYDVKYSGNLEHKISMELDVSMEDWVRVADIVNDVVIGTIRDASGDYISLDDEYTLYWDNVVDLCDVNMTTEMRNQSTTLGRGWDVQTDDSKDVVNMNSSLKNSPSGMFADMWAGSGGAPDLTDTTKWIYSKYVTFNVDMYGFTEGPAYTLLPSYDPKNPHAGDMGTESARQFDPTTPANNGTSYNNLVYIPAGTPVHLGYYTPGGDDDGDNDGQFTDYGYNNGTTKDPNGDNYVYHFWCPLEVGESDSQVVAEFHVTTINNGDTGAGNQAAWAMAGTSRYLRSPEKYAGLDTTNDDEWGNDILKVGSTNNEDNLAQISVNLVNNNSPDVSVHVDRNKNIYTRYGGSYKTAVMSVAGRIGALTVVDSGDPRYQDTFKNPTNNSEYAITPIVLAVLQYTNTETIGAPGSQRRYLTDKSDIRGRLWMLPTTTNAQYNLKIPFNTYGTQWFKDITDRYLLPMGKDFNIHSDSDLPEQRLGYEIYCSLETIGNYYGSASWRINANEDPSNLNDDYGQTKIQVRPFYVYVDSHGNVTPLDVYMRRNGNYVLLNAGSEYSSAAENTALGGHDAGPYWVDAAHSAYYSMSIKSNTNIDWNDSVTKTYRLDQTLLRRMVTQREAETTYYVMYTDKNQTSNPAVTKGITETLLEPFKLDTSAEEDLLDYSYYYGNTQIEFLREQNRTFIGGVNNYINDNKEQNWTNRAKRYGQKWYFGLGLPASAVFVKHGKHEFTAENIINGKDGVILVLIDVYAVGEKWVLHYQSELSDEGIRIDGHDIPADEWKVYPDRYPNLIPVSMYRADQLAPNDIDDRGTY